MTKSNVTPKSCSMGPTVLSPLMQLFWLLRVNPNCAVNFWPRLTRRTSRFRTKDKALQQASRHYQTIRNSFGGNIAKSAAFIWNFNAGERSRFHTYRSCTWIKDSEMPLHPALDEVVGTSFSESFSLSISLSFGVKDASQGCSRTWSKRSDWHPIWAWEIPVDKAVDMQQSVT